MQNILSLANEIKIEFDLFYSAQLPSIETRLCLLIQKAKSCSDFESARIYLNQIDEIESILARLYYKYELDLPVKIDNFLYDYDRIVGMSIDNYFLDIFNSIKDNKLVI